MGMTALAVVGGLATAGLSAYAMSQMSKAQQSQSVGQLKTIQNNNAAQAVETVPKPPEAPTGNTDDAATNPAEEARKQQLAAMAETEKMVNPTGGGGLGMPANTKKKTLGGGL